MLFDSMIMYISVCKLRSIALLHSSRDKLWTLDIFCAVCAVECERRQQITWYILRECCLSLQWATHRHRGNKISKINRMKRAFYSLQFACTRSRINGVRFISLFIIFGTIFSLECGQRSVVSSKWYSKEWRTTAAAAAAVAEASQVLQPTW